MKTGKANQIAYYANRALEYELVYKKPERQHRLRAMEVHLADLVKGQSVKEIGCGTGYWTVIMSSVTQKVVATDINRAMLSIARSKTYPKENVSFVVEDYEALEDSEATYDVLFAGFVWSHILKENRSSLLRHWFTQLQPSGRIILMDNLFVDDNNSPIIRTDERGNTYQCRCLLNGNEYEVLKNFDREKEFAKWLKQKDLKMNWWDFEYYWTSEIWKD